MANCYQIEVCNIPEGVPKHFLVEGRLYLDMPKEQSLKLRKNISELNDVNNIKLDGALSILLPFTKINKLVLDKMFFTDSTPTANEVVDVIVWKDANPLLFRKLVPFRKNDKNCTYEVSLNFEDHWALLAAKCKLCEIDFKEYSEFEMSAANVDAICEDIYIDGNTPYNFPPAYYGDFSFLGFNEGVPLSLLRPWYSPLYLLKQLGCKIGWNIKSPLLETEYWRSKWMYLSDKNYGINNDGKQYNLTAFSEFEQNDNFNQVGDNDYQLLFTDYSDDYGAFNGVTYQETGEYCFDLKLVTCRNNTLSGAITLDNQLIRIVKKDSNGNEATIAQEVFSLEPKDCKEITLQATTLMRPGESICVRYTGTFLYRTFKFTLNGRKKRYIYNDGDVMDMSSLLSCDISLLDTIKGLLHLFDGKIRTDHKTRCITLMPPYNVNVCGEDIEGFYKDDAPKDLSDKLICNSRVTKIVVPNRKRYCVLGFRKSKDPVRDTLNLEEKEELHDNVIDLGGQLEDGYTYKRNPLFEVTTLIENTDVTAFAAPVHLPNLTDNDEGNISYDIQPRILCFKKSLQVHQAGGVGINISGVTHQQFLTGYHNLSEEDFTINDFTTDECKEVLAYGTAQADLFQMYYKRDLNKLSYGSHKFDFFINDNYYFNEDCRSTFCLTTDGEYLLLRVTSIDYQACKNIATIYFNEEQNPDCTTLTDDSNKCNNSFYPTCEKVGDCFTFLVDGSGDSEVCGAVWEWKYTDETVWNAPVNALTFDVCNPIKKFDYRVRIITCDDCSDIVRTGSKDPCGNEAVINWDCYYNIEGEPCFKVHLSGIVSPIFNTTLVYKINGGMPVLIDFGNEVCLSGMDSNDEFEVCLNGLIELIDDCEDISIVSQCKTFPFPQVNCQTFDIIPNCIKDENGCYSFGLTGTLPVPIDQLIVLFEYKCDGGNAIRWDNTTPICCTPSEVRVIIFHCNEQCPPQCTEWTPCN